MDELLLNIENAQEIINQKLELINKKEDELTDLACQQERLCVDLINKLKPVYDQIRNSGYYFRHPKFNYKTSSGPIIGFNEEEGLVYVFDVDSKCLKVNNLINNEKSSSISFYNYFRKNSFEDAMEGLLYALNTYDLVLSEYDELIKTEKVSIGKYTKILDGII